MAKETPEQRVHRHSNQVWMLTSSIDDTAEHLSRMRKMRREAQAKLDRAYAALAKKSKVSP